MWSWACIFSRQSMTVAGLLPRRWWEAARLSLIQSRPLIHNWSCCHAVIGIYKINDMINLLILFPWRPSTHLKDDRVLQKTQDHRYLKLKRYWLQWTVWHHCNWLIEHGIGDSEMCTIWIRWWFDERTMILFYRWWYMKSKMMKRLSWQSVNAQGASTKIFNKRMADLIADDRSATPRSHLHPSLWVIQLWVPTASVLVRSQRQSSRLGIKGHFVLILMDRQINCEKKIKFEQSAPTKKIKKNKRWLGGERPRRNIGSGDLCAKTTAQKALWCLCRN